MTNAALTKLADSLRDANRRSAGRFETDTWQVIKEEVSRTSKWLKNGLDAEKPSKSRIEAAVAAFRNHRRFDAFSDARFVCYGCVESVGPKSYKLIEDPTIFPVVLSEVDKFQETLRLYRRCYRGLLSGYFIYDPSEHEDGKRNWHSLREYLRSRLSKFDLSDSTPDWVTTILQHKNLVTERACQRYSAAALNGDTKDFDDACLTLGVTKSSWVIRDFILSQIAEACASEDGPFQHRIPHILVLLEANSLLLNQGLALVLTRFSGIEKSSQNANLRDFAVQYWGNPWLSSNAAKWGQVSHAVRGMVSGWLKRHFIKQFFSLLADEGVSDNRRLRFWERYYEQIDDMYFALGPSAMRNQRREFRQLRNEMKGRLLELTNPGSQDNNAFIMKIGGHVAVEFGVSGNACFIFEADNLPFALIGSVAANRTSLKHDSRRHWLRHKDRANEPWEKEFEAVLANLAKPLSKNRHPAAPTISNRPGWDGKYGTSSAPISLGVSAPVSSEYFTDERFSAFARRQSLLVEDRQDKGGALWVLVPNDNGAVAKQLDAWSFRWSDKKQQWYRKD